MKPSTVCVILLIMALSGMNPASAERYCSTTQDRDCFTGSFNLIDIPDSPNRKRLGADFGYVDRNGLGWQTNKDAETDGASIPPLLQPFVGSPWEDGYIRAAVIHDWYCDRHVRPWQDTHVVFYNAMLASGLGAAKAKLMFYAVYSFGPRWGYLVPGTPCSGTKNCVQNIGKAPALVLIPDQYNNRDHISELKAVEALIERAEHRQALSLDELMAIADKAHPGHDLKSAPQNGGVAE